MKLASVSTTNITNISHPVIIHFLRSAFACGILLPSIVAIYLIQHTVTLPKKAESAIAHSKCWILTYLTVDSWFDFIPTPIPAVYKKTGPG